MFGWIRSLFGPTRPAPPPRDVMPLVAHLLRPALRLQRGDTPSRSWFGGDPLLPTDVAWPRGDDGPLAFLARLSLAEMQAALPAPWLPQHGALLFFHGGSGWGGSPGDRANHAVLWVADLDAPQAQTATVGSGRRQRSVASNLQPVRIQTLPPFDDPQLDALDLDDDEADGYLALQEVPFGDAPRHQFGGYDTPVQCSGMQADCEQMANGRRGVEPAVAARRWSLLLQIDSDQALGFNWGDGGRLYFWVEPDRAEHGDFSNAWRMLQCH